MCRQNQLIGCALIAFGIGVLLGMCLESGFLCGFLGFGLVILGFCVLRRR